MLEATEIYRDAFSAEIILLKIPFSSPTFWFILNHDLFSNNHVKANNFLSKYHKN